MALMPLADQMFLLPESREQPMHVGSSCSPRRPGPAPTTSPSCTSTRCAPATSPSPSAGGRTARSRRSVSGRGATTRTSTSSITSGTRHFRRRPRPRAAALVSRLHGSLLDRHRPFWEMHVIEGLADGRFAGLHEASSRCDGRRLRASAAGAHSVADPDSHEVRIPVDGSLVPASEVGRRAAVVASAGGAVTHGTSSR